MRKLHNATAFLRDELRAASSLISLIALSLVIVLALARTGVTLAYPSFQSPESPVATPTATPSAVETPETPIAPSPEVPTPIAPPVETTPVSPISPTVTTGMETPTVEPELTPAEGAPVQEPTPAPVAEEEPPGEPGSPWAVLVDTCVVGFSYVWLACGGMVLVLFVLGVVLSFLLRRA